LEVSDVIARPYIQGDEKQIVELLELVFNGWPKLDLPLGNLEYWKWFYLDNPLKTNNNIVATINKQIVGSNLGAFREVRINGEKYTTCLSGGLAVHPDHRGKGVYSKMRDLKHQRHDEIKTNFTWAITVNPQVIAALTKRGHEKFPYELQMMTKIHDIRKHIQQTGGDLSKHILYNIKKAQAAIRLDRRKKDYEIKLLESYFDEDIDVFWKKVRASYRFIGERDRSNLNWRFRDPRAGNYVVLCAYENGSISGYLVLLINRNNPDYPIGYIVDILATGQDIVEALIDKSLDYFDSLNVNVINYLSVKDYPYQQTFARKGFFKQTFSAFIEFYPRTEVAKKAIFTDALPSQIHFQYSDLDLF
jgi:hypothetical protein